MSLPSRKRVRYCPDFSTPLIDVDAGMATFDISNTRRTNSNFCPSTNPQIHNEVWLSFPSVASTHMRTRLCALSRLSTTPTSNPFHSLFPDVPRSSRTISIPLWSVPNPPCLLGSGLMVKRVYQQRLTLGASTLVGNLRKFLQTINRLRKPPSHLGHIHLRNRSQKQ